MTDIYLSGRFTVNTAIEKAWLKRTGCKHRCFSFAFVNETKPIQGFYNKRCVEALKVCEKAKIKIMMDSGAFSIHTLRRKMAKKGLSPIEIDTQLGPVQEKMFESYAAFCTKHKHLWEFYITLDFKTKQDLILAMQNRFLTHNLEPMPVYHGDSSLDFLSKHKDMGHTYICIGGMRLHPGKHGIRYYYDKVFNYGAKHGLEYHGLAMTSMSTILHWPFRSVDSSTWSQVAAYGLILMPNLRLKRFHNLHVSDKYCKNGHSHHTMSKAQKGEIREFLAHYGFDFDAMRNNESERHDWNGYLMSNLPKFGIEHSIKKTWGSLL